MAAVDPVAAVPAREGEKDLDLPAMLKEAGITAAIVLALCIGLVGFRIADVPGGLAIVTRFDDVAFVVAYAFIGRIGLILLRENRPLPVLNGGAVLTALLLGVDLADLVYLDDAAISTLLPFDSPVVGWLLALITFVFTMRAGLRVWQHSSSLTDVEREERMDRVGAKVQRVAWVIGPLLFGAAIVFPFLPQVDRRLLDIGILVMTYVMLGWGLNIVVGLAGLLDLGYVAFYAVGAYSYALLAQYFGFGFWTCLPFAGFMAAMAGVILGFPVLRLRGDYLAIVTLGFGEMIRIILLNWYDFTNGPAGVSGIPRPSFFGLAEFTRSPDEGVVAFHQLFGIEYDSVQRIIFLYYLILGLALIVNLFTMRIRRLPTGRAWEALREDETACRSLGINPRNTKLTAFGIGAMFGGFAGSFFATRQGFISPESFTFIESAVVLAVVVLGGFGSQIGVVIAAFLLIGLPEFFRELQDFRMLAFGASMVLIMLWRPAGLLAHREPTIRLFGRGGKEASG